MPEVGDVAAAAGLPLVPGSLPAKQIDTEINLTRDLLVQLAGGIRAVTAGGTGAATPAEARGNLKTPHDDTGSILRFFSPGFGLLSYEIPGVAYPTRLVTAGEIPDLSGYATDGELDSVRDGNLTTGVYNRNITWTRRTAWIGDNGQLGYASSSERYKKHIRPMDVTDEQVAMLVLVSFQWRAAVAADDRREVGLIAERLVDAGLGWAVFTDPDGRPEGINYDMIGLVLLPAVQRLIRDRDSIIQRLEALESAGA